MTIDDTVIACLREHGPLMRRELLDLLGADRVPAEIFGAGTVNLRVTRSANSRLRLSHMFETLAFLKNQLAFYLPRQGAELGILLARDAKPAKNYAGVMLFLNQLKIQPLSRIAARAYLTWPECHSLENTSGYVPENWASRMQFRKDGLTFSRTGRSPPVWQPAAKYGIAKAVMARQPVHPIMITELGRMLLRDINPTYETLTGMLGWEKADAAEYQCVAEASRQPLTVYVRSVDNTGQPWSRMFDYGAQAT